MPSRKQQHRNSRHAHTKKGKLKSKLNKINNDSRSKQKNKTILEEKQKAFNKSKPIHLQNHYKYTCDIFSEYSYSNERRERWRKYIIDHKDTYSTYSESMCFSSIHDPSLFHSWTTSSSSFSTSSDEIAYTGNLNLKFCITLKQKASKHNLYCIELKYLSMNGTITNHYCRIKSTSSSNIEIKDKLRDIYRICCQCMQYIKPEGLNDKTLEYNNIIWKCDIEDDIFTLCDILKVISEHMLTPQACKIIVGYIYLENECDDLIFINVFGQSKYEWNSWNFGPKYAYSWNLSDYYGYFDELMHLQFEERYESYYHKCYPQIELKCDVNRIAINTIAKSQYKKEFEIMNEKYQHWVSRARYIPKHQKIFHKILHDENTIDFNYSQKQKIKNWYQKKKKIYLP